MRTAPMCFTVFRVPRCRVYSLVNTWWEGFDSLSQTCKDGRNFRLSGTSVRDYGTNSGRWSRRPITTKCEEKSKKVLSSAVNIRQGITDETLVSVTTNLNLNKTTDRILPQIQTTDVRELIAENKELAEDVTFLVFDIETTGLKRSDEKIIEIALRDVKGGPNSIFHTLVNPKRAVTNSYIHGITTEMVSKPGVPRMEELIPILLHFVRSRQKKGGYVVLIAHNSRCFDVPFLVHEFACCSTAIPSDWLFLDTLSLARELMKSLGVKGGANTSLKALREHYKIPLEGSAHRAMSDVHCLSLVLQRLTFDLKLLRADLVQKSFTVDELASSSIKKKKNSS